VAGKTGAGPSGMTLSVAAQGHRAARGFTTVLSPVRSVHRRRLRGEPLLEEPVNHSMTSGMPAANQTPPTFRIKSTGLSQELEGAGERISSIVKSPSAASATA